MSQTPMRPLFSIITVTLNAEQTIEPTLRSVASQTCGLYEHIIMDGASTDRTLQIVKELATPQAVVESKPDKGIYDAMNAAISKSQGDYLIFLNSGDRFHSPDTLQRIADAIMANDYPGIVYGQTQIIDSEGRVLGPRHLEAPEELTLESFSDGMVVCHQAFAVLKRITPLYNTRYKYSSDYEWCILCLQHSRANVYVPGVMIDYLSQGMTTRHHRQSLIERFKIMCAYYGPFKAMAKHAKFLLRYLRRRKSAPNNQ